MSLSVTLIILGIAAAILGLAIWHERRPRELGTLSLVPWVPIMMVSTLVVILMLAHLVTLLTGQPFTGRMGI